MTAAARLHGVSLRLGIRNVLDNVGFTLAQGEFVGLLGPNGAGKTTLLRALLGLVPPVSGRIEVLGGPARPGRAGIGYMPQSRSRAATLRLCARDVVMAAVNGGGWGLPCPTRAERAAADEAIAWAGAAHLARRPFAELSGGERQRLMLAEALLNRPRLLLLDEPLVNLDPAAQVEIVALAAHLRHQLGCTIVFSSHELNPILGAMDRVLYLANRQAAIGAPDTVITSAVLSRLYAAPVDVVHAAGRIFVMPAEPAAARHSA